MITVAGRPTTSKTRIIARSQQIVRIDDEVETLLDGPDLDAADPRRARRAGGRRRAPARGLQQGRAPAQADRGGDGGGAPPRHPHRRGPQVSASSSSTPGATVFKPNRRELESALGAAVDLQNGNALPEVLARLKADNLLVTLGAEGMVLVMKDGSLTHIPSIARDDLRRVRRGRHGHGLDGAALAAGASSARRRRSPTTRRAWRWERRAWRRCRPRRCSRCTRSSSIRSAGCGAGV